MGTKCDRDHEELKASDDATWGKLGRVGVQPAYTGDPADDLELRNCTCGSTLARRIGARVRAA